MRLISYRSGDHHGVGVMVDDNRFISLHRLLPDLPESLRSSKRELVLDLGKVKELAEVHLNGKNLGVVWAPPFRVDVSEAIQPTGNKLEIEVVNFWP